MFIRHRLAPFVIAISLLAGCATVEEPAAPQGPRPPPDMARQPNSPPLWPKAPEERDTRALVAKLLPASVKDKAGWANDLHAAFTHLKIPQVPETYCAALAVIEQESTYQVDPVVPNLPDIVWNELEQRGAKFGIPKLLISAAMLKTSPDGRSYQKRIDLSLIHI